MLVELIFVMGKIYYLLGGSMWPLSEHCLADIWVTDCSKEILMVKCKKMAIKHRVAIGHYWKVLNMGPPKEDIDIHLFVFSFNTII